MATVEGSFWNGCFEVKWGQRVWLPSNSGRRVLLLFPPFALYTAGTAAQPQGNGQPSRCFELQLPGVSTSTANGPGSRDLKLKNKNKKKTPRRLVGIAGLGDITSTPWWQVSRQRHLNPICLLSHNLTVLLYIIM